MKQLKFLGGIILLLSLGISTLGVLGWRLAHSPEPIKTGPTPLPLGSLTGQNIVYLLVDDSLGPENSMSPTRLQDKLGAKIARSWDDVMAIDKRTPISALIMHNSALPLVDRVWLANAYRRGVVIVGFNLYGPQLANLVNDPCIAKDRFAADPYPGPFYVIVSFSIAGNNPAAVALVEGAYQRSCGEEPPTGAFSETVSLSRGSSTYDLNNDNDFNLFTQTLLNHLKSKAN